MQDTISINETKRSDLYKVDPRNIKIKEGYNIRKINPQSEDIIRLKDSIRENGLKKPLVLKTNPDFEKDGKEYVTVDGHRRMTAINLLIEEGEPIEYVRAEIHKRMNDEQALLSMFTLNDSELLNPIEKAEGVRRLVEVYGYSPKDVSQKIAERPSTVSNLLKLAGMPKAVKNKIEDNVISATFALDLARKSVSDEEFASQVEEITKNVEVTSAPSETKTKRALVTSSKVKEKVGEKNTVKLLKQVAIELDQEGYDNEKIDLLTLLIQELEIKPTVANIRKIFE